MGGSSKKTTKPAEKPDEYKGATTPQVLVLGGMPAQQQGLLTQQLAQGFGGTQAEQAPQIAGMLQAQNVPYVQRPSDVLGLLQQQGVKPGLINAESAKKKAEGESARGSNIVARLAG